MESLESVREIASMSSHTYASVLTLFLIFLLPPPAFSTTRECWRGTYTSLDGGSVGAVSSLCFHCNYCIKVEGTLHGNPFETRDCGCGNTIYECTSTGSVTPTVPGMNARAYCCKGNKCNSAHDHTHLASLISVVSLLLLRF